MKTSLKLLSLTALIASSLPAIAQQELQYFRPDSKVGLNVFETTKNDSTPFTKMKVFVGGNFEMAFQGLRDQNTATPLFQPPYVGM